MNPIFTVFPTHLILNQTSWGVLQTGQKVITEINAVQQGPLPLALAGEVHDQVDEKMAHWRTDRERPIHFRTSTSKTKLPSHSSTTKLAVPGVA